MISGHEDPRPTGATYRRSNAHPVGRVTAAEYRWNEVCRGWRLTSHDALHVDLEEMPPGTHEVLHAHMGTIQFYFVLSGTAVVRLGDRSVAVASGTGVEVLARVPHQIRNESDASLEFLVISSRPPRGDRVDLAAEPSESRPDQAARPPPSQGQL